MSNFVQRTLSGAVYVAVVVISILFCTPYLFCGLSALFAILAVREYHQLLSSPRITSVLSILLALWLFVWWGIMQYYGGLFPYSNAGLRLALIYPIMLLLVLMVELFAKADNPIQNWGNILVSQIMIALPIWLANSIEKTDAHLLLALFVCIWVDDSGAYCVGSLMGKRKNGNHKMFPRVSPGKSWEGLIGGILFALLAGVAFYKLGWTEAFNVCNNHFINALIFSIAVAIAGTLGDLMESLMKRTIGVKDSGKFMPGHGGILDRLDSFLLATPIVELLILLF